MLQFVGGCPIAHRAVADWACGAGAFWSPTSLYFSFRKWTCLVHSPDWYVCGDPASLSWHLSLISSDECSCSTRPGNRVFSHERRLINQQRLSVRKMTQVILLQCIISLMRVPSGTNQWDELLQALRKHTQFAMLACWTHGRDRWRCVDRVKLRQKSVCCKCPVVVLEAIQVHLTEINLWLIVQP